MSSEQEPAGFNGGYNPDGTWRWHVFNPNASEIEKKQVELDCMTRLKRIQEERTAHWRGLSEELREALKVIAEISSGSTSANSLPHIAKIAANALEGTTK